MVCVFPLMTLILHAWFCPAAMTISFDPSSFEKHKRLVDQFLSMDIDSS